MPLVVSKKATAHTKHSMSSDAEDSVSNSESTKGGPRTPDVMRCAAANSRHGDMSTDETGEITPTSPGTPPSKTEGTDPFVRFGGSSHEESATPDTSRTGEAGRAPKAASLASSFTSITQVGTSLPSSMYASRTMTLVTSKGNVITAPRPTGFSRSRAYMSGTEMAQSLIQRRANKATAEKAQQRAIEEAHLREEKRKKAAERVAGKKRRAEEKKQRAWRRREEEARQARRDGWYCAMVEEMQVLLDDIDWAVVLRSSRASVDASKVDLEKTREKPPRQDLAWARDATGREKAMIESMGEYGIWLVEMVRRIDQPHWREEETVRRNRLKLAALRDKGTQVAEAVGEGTWSEDEVYCKLKALDVLAEPLAEDLWKAETESMEENGRVRYVDGLPVHLAPSKWTVMPTSWSSRRDMRRKWTPCAQCEASGVIECSRERFLPEDPGQQPCSRCRRMDEVCIRLDPDWQDVDLEGLPTWTKYVAADQSLEKKEAQLRAHNLLQSRGKAFVNVCGQMVDAIDAEGFAPAMMPSLGPRSFNDEEDSLMPEYQSPICPELLSSSDEMSVEDFRARMAIVRSDEYWEEKAVAAGSGMADWGGGTREARRRGPVPVVVKRHALILNDDEPGPKRQPIVM